MILYNRRNFLSVGSLFIGSSFVGLPQILKAQEPSKRHKGLINIFLAGGPPHLDLWDLKPDAPLEVRGVFEPINTNVNGIQICEVFPNLAKRMDKCTIIRSIIGSHGDHAAHQCMTGWTPDNLKSIGGRPSIGSVVSKLQGAVDPSVPPFVGLAESTKHSPWSDAGSAGFLGSSMNAFKPNGDGLDDMILKDSLARLNDRQNLLKSLDSIQRTIDLKQQIKSSDVFTEKAFDILRDSKLLNALDLSKIDPEILTNYGDGKPFNFQYDGAPTDNTHLLLAKRLIEAGARVVSLSYGRWDSHGDNFGLVKDHGSKLDQCLSALIDDLDKSDMLDSTTVIVWGEFGRTPKVNKDSGRDHWPQVNGALLFGGGMRHGQVIGSTNKLGEYAQDRPVHVQEVFSTLYHSLGINTSQSTLIDTTGRPQYLTEYNPIRELV
jgi:hypothetical protein